MSDGATLRIAAPSATPSAPPRSDSTRLSVSSWRTIRRRPAPSADRTASSRSRAVARASSRLATFAQQISSTKPTTPRNSIEVSLRSLPIMVSCIGSSATPRPALVCGNSRARPSATAARSACAAWMADARLHAADDLQRYAPRARGGMLANGRIAHMLVRPRIWNSFGTTPTTVKGIPSSLIRCPMIDGSRSKRVARSPRSARPRWRVALRLREERAAGDRLDAEHVEDAGRHPLPRHRFGVAVAPAITMPPTLGVKPAMVSNVRLRSFQSSMFERRREARAWLRLGVSQIMTSRSGLAERQRAQQGRIDQREDGAVGADAERQRGRRDQREGGCRASCRKANFTSPRPSRTTVPSCMSQSLLLPRFRAAALSGFWGNRAPSIEYPDYLSNCPWTNGTACRLPRGSGLRRSAHGESGLTPTDGSGRNVATFTS